MRAHTILLNITSDKVSSHPDGAAVTWVWIKASPSPVVHINVNHLVIATTNCVPTSIETMVAEKSEEMEQCRDWLIMILLRYLLILRNLKVQRLYVVYDLPVLTGGIDNELPIALARVHRWNEGITWTVNTHISSTAIVVWRLASQGGGGQIWD